MTENELMIGDWVYTKAKERNVRVMGMRNDWECPFVLTDCDDAWCNIFEFQTIPLTGEILERNGFEKMSETPYLKEYRILVNEDSESCLFVKILRAGTTTVYFYADDKAPYQRLDFCKTETTHVHDLQHILRLCGIEKEIEL